MITVSLAKCCKCGHKTRKFTCPKCGHRICSGCHCGREKVEIKKAAA